jgi:glycosyltransferase involved in cell wall biosynthesis
MTGAPRVSVIMAVYNGIDHISEALASVQRQTMSDWELLVGDDGSTDGTPDLVESLQIPRLRLIRLSAPNRGSGAVRNMLIREAKGEFIAPMDADDVSVDVRLERELELLIDDPKLVAVSGQLAAFGEWGGPRRLVEYPTAPDAIAARFARRRMGVAHPASMFRRDVAIAMGGYDEYCLRAQDYALFLKLSSRPMMALPDTLLHYRTSGRPSFNYWMANKSYGRLANLRNAPGGVVNPAITQLPSGPKAWPNVARDALLWGYDRVARRRGSRVLR